MSSFKSPEEDNLKNVIIKQNEQILSQKKLIEQQLDFANNIQKEALQLSIYKLTAETENVKNKKNVNVSAVKVNASVKKAAPAKVNKPDVLNDTREMFGINAFNKSMDEKYNKK
jgi:hypothetical protein